MTHSRLFKPIAAAALLAWPAVLSAQNTGDISSTEDERLNALMRAAAEEWLTPRNNFTVGFRVLNSGASVRFGNLGTVPAQRNVQPASAGVGFNRIYDNGAVLVDIPRANEMEKGVQTSTPGGRYQTTVTDPDTDVTTVTGDFLSYTSGLTRNWGYLDSSQVTDTGYVAMSSYSATSDGGTAANQQGPTGGVELQFARRLSKSSKRMEWGFVAGLALNDINSKTVGSVLSTLHAYTDYYSLNGQTAPDAPYFSPDLDGNILMVDGVETTVPISEVPERNEQTPVVGGTSVTGNWQIKGAYFLLRLGPTLRTQLTERLGLSASLGIAGAYAGTRYSAVESFPIPEAPSEVVGGKFEQSSMSKFLSGYYADFNLEWAANERTGFFGGVTAQKLGDYDQSVGGRTANIDIGSAVGVRGGVSIKF